MNCKGNHIKYQILFYWRKFFQEAFLLNKYIPIFRLYFKFIFRFSIQAFVIASAWIFWNLEILFLVQTWESVYKFVSYDQSHTLLFFCFSLLLNFCLLFFFIVILIVFKKRFKQIIFLKCNLFVFINFHFTIWFWKILLKNIIFLIYNIDLQKTIPAFFSSIIIIDIYTDLNFCVSYFCLLIVNSSLF